MFALSFSLCFQGKLQSKKLFCCFEEPCVLCRWRKDAGQETGKRVIRRAVYASPSPGSTWLSSRSNTSEINKSHFSHAAIAKKQLVILSFPFLVGLLREHETCFLGRYFTTHITVEGLPRCLAVLGRQMCREQSCSSYRQVRTAPRSPVSTDFLAITSRK